MNSTSDYATVPLSWVDTVMSPRVGLDVIARVYPCLDPGRVVLGAISGAIADGNRGFEPVVNLVEAPDDDLGAIATADSAVEPVVDTEINWDVTAPIGRGDDHLIDYPDIDPVFNPDGDIVLTNSPSPKHQCKDLDCPQVFTRKTSAERHYRKQHQDIREETTCMHPNCGRILSSPRRAGEHYRSVHQAIGKTSCKHPSCGKILSNRWNARRHHQTSHPGLSKTAIARLYEWVFVKKVRSPPRETPTKCKHPSCPATLASPINMQKHYNSKHLSIKRTPPPKQPTTCKNPGCSKILVSPKGMRRHYNRMHLGVNYPKQPSSCKYPGCSKILSSPSQMEKHYKRVHLGIKIAQSRKKRTVCNYPDCMKILSSARGMRTHYNSVHLGHKTKCRHPTCDKFYASRSSAYIHYQKHHENIKKEEERTKCEYPNCNKKFATPATARRHYQDQHVDFDEGNLPQARFHCEYPDCGKQFVTVTGLMTHMQQHSETFSSKFCCTFGDCSGVSTEKHLLVHLFVCHNQRQLLISPPYPGVDLSELQYEGQFGDGSKSDTSRSEDAASMETTDWTRPLEIDSALQDNPFTVIPAGNNLSSIRETNHIRAQSCAVWLDRSNEGDSCVGPGSTTRRLQRKKTSLYAKRCPFEIKLTYSTARLVLKVGSRIQPTGKYVFQYLKLSSRCIHCDVVKNLGKELTPTRRTRKCPSTGCSAERWQGVGMYCDKHYMLFYSHFSRLNPSGMPKEVPRSLIKNGSNILHDLARRTFSWNSLSPRLQTTLRALLDSKPDAPKAYALDTEFYRERKTGERKVSEIAIVEIETGNIVVHATFNNLRAMEVHIKLARLQSRPNSQESTLTRRHVSQVHTVDGMIQQIKACHFKPGDTILEYINGETLVDFDNLRKVLVGNGCNFDGLFPGVCALTTLNAIKAVFRQVFKLPSWNLELVFRVMFPQDPLVAQNHSAAVDAIQLARIIRQMADLSNPADSRKLAPDLLQGLESLSSWNGPNDEITQPNTLDRYYKPLSCLPAKLDVEMRQNNDDDEEELAKGDLADGDRIANDIEYEFEVHDADELHVEGIEHTRTRRGIGANCRAMGFELRTKRKESPVQCDLRRSKRRKIGFSCN